jgi:hypothetical protein
MVTNAQVSVYTSDVPDHKMWGTWGHKCGHKPDVSLEHEESYQCLGVLCNIWREFQLKFLFDRVCAETTFAKKSSNKMNSKIVLWTFETMDDRSWLDILIKINANTSIKSWYWEDSIKPRDHAIAQAGRCWLLALEPLVQSQVTSCDICGSRNVTREGFSLEPFLDFPCSIARYSFITASRGVW